MCPASSILAGFRRSAVSMDGAIGVGMEDAPVLSPPTGKERIHCKYNSPNTIMCTPDKHPQVLFLPPAIRSKRVHQNVRIGAVGVIGAVIAANVFDALLAMAVTFSVEVDVALTGAVIAGFAAQMVDGALGMGFGMTSTTVMVSVAGLSPLAASTSVHLAQLGQLFRSSNPRRSRATPAYLLTGLRARIWQARQLSRASRTTLVATSTCNPSLDSPLLGWSVPS